MKKIALILLLFLIFTACHNNSQKAPFLNVEKKDAVEKPDTAISQKTNIGSNKKPILKKHIKHIFDSTVISPYDTITLLTKVFDPDSIDEDHIIYWRPDTDFDDLLISDDGYCHTGIDSIIKIPGTKYPTYLIIFATYGYNSEGGKNDCHPCGAGYGMALVVGEPDTAKRQEKRMFNYKIMHSQKNFTSAGSFGGGGEISLENFGKEYALHVSGGFTGMGETTSDEDYYNIYTGADIFSYTSFDDDEMYGGKTYWDYISLERKLKKIPTQKGEWDELKLSFRITRYDTIRHRHYDSTSVEYYRMNTDSNQYVMVKK